MSDSKISNDNRNRDYPSHNPEHEKIIRELEQKWEAQSLDSRVAIDNVIYEGVKREYQDEINRLNYDPNNKDSVEKFETLMGEILHVQTHRLKENYDGAEKTPIEKLTSEQYRKLYNSHYDKSELEVWKEQKVKELGTKNFSRTKNHDRDRI